MLNSWLTSTIPLYFLGEWTQSAIANVVNTTLITREIPIHKRHQLRRYVGWAANDVPEWQEMGYYERLFVTLPDGRQPTALFRSRLLAEISCQIANQKSDNRYEVMRYEPQCWVTIGMGEKGQPIYRREPDQFDVAICLGIGLNPAQKFLITKDQLPSFAAVMTLPVINKNKYLTSGKLPRVSRRYLEQQCPLSHWSKCRRYDRWSAPVLRTNAQAWVTKIQQEHQVIKDVIVPSY